MENQEVEEEEAEMITEDNGDGSIQKIFSLLDNEIFQLDESFNLKIFEILIQKIYETNGLQDMFKNNCEGLYKVINTIKEDKSLTLSDQPYLNITDDISLKFFGLSFMIIYNWLLDPSKINFENKKIGSFPACDFLGEIINSKEIRKEYRRQITSINLKNNNLYSEGIKKIMEPIFNNQERLKEVGSKLDSLQLDSNKLNGKALKYIRHLLKVSENLTILTLSNNYIKGSALFHLVNASKSLSKLEKLYLNSNMLGGQCGADLSSILENLTSLKELNLSNNSLGDTPIPSILNILKEHNTIEVLLLINNDITQASAGAIAGFLSNNKSLQRLWINNNPLGGEGIKAIAQALSTQLVLEEINLSSTRMGDEGGKELFENLKLNKSLRRLYCNCNNLEKESMVKFGEYMQKDNENENPECGLEFLSLSVNSIYDECIQDFAEELSKYRWLKEFKINSNYITDEGGELLLTAVNYNPNIEKISLENNYISSFELNSENLRPGVKVYL